MEDRVPSSVARKMGIGGGLRVESITPIRSDTSRFSRGTVAKARLRAKIGLGMRAALSQCCVRSAMESTKVLEKAGTCPREETSGSHPLMDAR